MGQGIENVEKLTHNILEFLGESDVIYNAEIIDALERVIAIVSFSSLEQKNEEMVLGFSEEHFKRVRNMMLLLIKHKHVLEQAKNIVEQSPINLIYGNKSNCKK